MNSEGLSSKGAKEQQDTTECSLSRNTKIDLKSDEVPFSEDEDISVVVDDALIDTTAIGDDEKCTNGSVTTVEESSIPLPTEGGLHRQGIYRGTQNPGAYEVRPPRLLSSSSSSISSSISSSTTSDHHDESDSRSNLGETPNFYAVQAELVVPPPTAQVHPIVDDKIDLEAQQTHQSMILVSAKPFQSNEEDDTSTKKKEDVKCIRRHYLLAYVLILIASITLVAMLLKSKYGDEKVIIQTQPSNDSGRNETDGHKPPPPVFYFEKFDKSTDCDDFPILDVLYNGTHPGNNRTLERDGRGDRPGKRDRRRRCD